MMTNGKTIATALKNAVATLSLNKNIDTKRLDAEILLCHVLGCQRIDLIINKDKILDDISLSEYNDLIDRRAKNEPVSYITGKKEFMSLEFHVESGILIPRPDTEILVEEIINLYKDKSVNILDLCTGSGAIAASLAYYLKKASVTAVDKFDICIDVALKNINKYNLSNRVSVIKKDILEDIEIDVQFDCIVSNPPYIRTDVLSTLPYDVKDYEPQYALDGGNDGLIFYRKITDFAKNKLKSGGTLAYEIGYDQGFAVTEIIKKTDSFKEIRLINDLSGRNRVIIAKKE